MIYLDQAATSWPKPDAVPAAMVRFLAEQGGNPGRSGHRASIEAARVVGEARERVARLLGLADPLSVIFTKNATEALNLAILGLLRPGDHAVASAWAHNSVLRPLRHLEEQGVSVTRLPGGADGSLDPDEVAEALTPRTRLLVVGHASNVVGTLLPLAELGRLAAGRELLFCVDAAQTAGACPLDMGGMGIDLLAFSGHKSLLGPQGTGGLCLGARALGRLRPLLYGGTGSLSDSDEQPDFLPDRFEAGTLNGVGLAGLCAGLEVVQRMGLPAIAAHGRALTAQLIEGLRELSGLRVLGTGEAARQIPVVSFELHGWSCTDVAAALEDRAGVCCRAGLHCAPLSHRRLGTFPGGAVRFSPGILNTGEEIAAALGALGELCRTSPAAPARREHG